MNTVSRPTGIRLLIGLLLVGGLGVVGSQLWHQRHAQAVAEPTVRVGARPTHEPARPSAHALTLGQFLVVPRLPHGRLNFLIAGVTPEYIGYHRAAPENFTGLTDSMMLLQLDPQRRTVRLLSLPRDTRVQLADLGVHKLNAAIALLGAEGLQAAVEHLTGLHLSGYLLLNLDAVRDLTDAIGGVQVYVPEAMNYDDVAAGLHIHFPAGPHRFTGPEAATYIRFRHDALGDIGRVKRQQAYVRALGQQLLTPQVLLHLSALSQILADDTRSNVSQQDVSAILGMLLARPQLETYLYPGRFYTEQRVSYWQPDPAAARALLALHFEQAPAHPRAAATDPAQARIRVVNVGADAATVQQVRTRLTHLGDGNVQVVQATGGDPAKTVLLSEGDPALLQGIQRQLGFGETRLSGEGVLDADVTVWLGQDALGRTWPGDASTGTRTH